MSLIKRIIDVWTTSADEELYRVLDEWRIEFSFDEEFMHVVGVLESHIVDADYSKAEVLFSDYYPDYMTQDEAFHFLSLLDEAKYYYG